LRAVGVSKPTWSSSSFLLYLGGFTVLSAAISALGILRDDYGDPGFVGWCALIFAVLSLIAAMFRVQGHWIAAGLFAVSGVIAWGILVGAVFSWWGWLAHPDHIFDGFHVSLLLLAVLVLSAAVVKNRIYRFPLLTFIAAAAGWYFVVDLVSGGGGWSAIVSAIVGLVYLIWAVNYDRGPLKPAGFWLHLASGLAIGGAIYYFFHTGNWDFAILAVAGLVYIRIGARLDRSSWTVLGAGALLASATHYAAEWADARFQLFSDTVPQYRDWVFPLMSAILGFVYVLLGLAVARRRTD
jgi:hypothetical protein